jgi:O-antigen/teichoic acid export membrane protein
LAQYAIGRFGEPVVTTVRNSVSSVVLPEMVRKDRGAAAGATAVRGAAGGTVVGGTALALWQKATVVNAIMLLPIVVLVVRYADPLVTFVFGPNYVSAALVMQIYMLVVVRECVDFGPALRAVNRTRPLVESNVASFLACSLSMLALIPLAGLAGAMLAFVVSSYVDVLWLGWRTLQAYDVRLSELLPWRSLAKTALAALVAALLLVNSAWTDMFGRAGIVLAGLVYVTVFALLLQMMRIPEALVLQAWGKRLVFRRAPQA